jgi:flagellar hook protein FlgE
MGSEVSTIQSLKAVDAWIDVINANINGGVRTAFKASRLKFAGSNVDVSRAGTTTSLPLQFPEPGLTTANTVIDFSQGAITASTENTHLAIQGEGFFLIGSPDTVITTAGVSFGATASSNQAQFYFTRDGEFHTDSHGLLVNSDGYYLLSFSYYTIGGRNLFGYDTTGSNGLGVGYRAIYNDLDGGTPPAAGGAVPLSIFLQNGSPLKDLSNNSVPGVSFAVVTTGKQSLKYTRLGSTVFDFGFKVETAHTFAQLDPNINYTSSQGISNVLNKSLEASNASMTQSVPELSLAQKLFSALTKVLQTKQTNVDGVLNLVR